MGGGLEPLPDFQIFQIKGTAHAANLRMGAL
jgi:hypothetical protein